MSFSNFDTVNAEASLLEVIATDTSESLVRENARRFAGSARVTYVDHENLFEHLNGLSQAPLLVIHNGACSSTTERNPEVFERLNLGYTKKVWEYCARLNIPLIYASSAATYGDGLKGFSDKKEHCSQYKSLNLYGQSKLDFDLWALEQQQTPPTWFGLRYFNVYGQHEGHKLGQASMAFHGYNQALKNGNIKLFKSNASIYADGEQVRDFVYVDDVVDVTIKLMKVCLERSQSCSSLVIPNNGCFVNVGTGKEETWNHLAQCVFKAIGISCKIEYIPMPESLVNQYQNYTCADLSTLKFLGIDHKFRTLEEGVTRYVQKFLFRGVL